MTLGGLRESERPGTPGQMRRALRTRSPVRGEGANGVHRQVRTPRFPSVQQLAFQGRGSAHTRPLSPASGEERRMAYRVNNIGLWLDEPEEQLGQRAAEKLGVTRADLASVRVVRSVL